MQVQTGWLVCADVLWDTYTNLLTSDGWETGFPRIFDLPTGPSDEPFDSCTLGVGVKFSHSAAQPHVDGRSGKLSTFI